MADSPQNLPVMEMRIALTAQHFEQLLELYSIGLGLEPAAEWSNDGGRAILLEMGTATLELFDENQAIAIDQIEAGRRTSGQIRFALQVPDLDAAMKRMLAHGAELVNEPVETPWGDRNVRLQDPDGMQITLFEPPGGEK